MAGDGIKHILYDPRTGEHIRTVYEGDYVKIIPRQLAPLPPKEHSRTPTPYIKVAQKALPLLAKIPLSKSEQAVLWVIAGNMPFRSGRIAHSNGKAFTMNSLADYAGVTKQVLSRALASLEKKGFICRPRQRSTEIYMNPYFAARGCAIPDALRDMFIGTEFYRVSAGKTC